MELSIIIPCYNGAAFVVPRLTHLVKGLESVKVSREIIVVDDGSRDDSADVIERAELPNVRVHRLAQNQGKFGAIIAGMAEARGTCRVFTDADIPFEVPAIPYIADLVNRRGFHIVAGDRHLPGSRYHVDLPPVRRFATGAFSAFVRFVVAGGLQDTQCGLKGFRGDVADALFPLLTERRFAGDVELLYIALKYNLEIKRIPVRLDYSGDSTVRPGRDAVNMLRALARIRYNFGQGRYQSEELRQIAAQDYGRG
jgi:dolichyl-phosphate beta-glucosyltransferase